MPTLYEFLEFRIYFWSNEGEPLEPVHVHASIGRPVEHSTKFWILSDGSVSLADNGSKIPAKQIHLLERFISNKSSDIINSWCKFHGVEPVYIDTTNSDN